MSDVIIPSDSDRHASPESIQEYLLYLEDKLDEAEYFLGRTEKERDCLLARVDELEEAIEIVRRLVREFKAAVDGEDKEAGQ